MDSINHQTKSHRHTHTADKEKDRQTQTGRQTDLSSINESNVCVALYVCVKLGLCRCVCACICLCLCLCVCVCVCVCACACLSLLMCMFARFWFMCLVYVHILNNICWSIPTVRPRTWWCIFGSIVLKLGGRLMTAARRVNFLLERCVSMSCVLKSNTRQWTCLSSPPTIHW